MEKMEIVRKFLDEGILLEPEVLDRVAALPPGEIDALIFDMASRGIRVASLVDLNQGPPDGPGAIQAPIPRLDVQTEPFVFGSDTRIDYLKYFQNRFDRIASILRGRNGYQDCISIIDVKSGSSRPVTTIGMVCEKGSEPGRVDLEVEDGTGRIGLIPAGSETGAVAGCLVLDEIVGIRGRFDDGSGKIEIDGIDFPDIEEQNSPLPPERIYAAFLSDLHFGSKDFMRDAFEGFIDFLKGKHEDPELGKIGSLTKFIVLCGDLIDGDGNDMMGKYNGLARLLGRVPEDAIIFSIPGENDTSGILEPQAGFLDEANQAFSELGNFRAGSNPCMVRLNSLPVLLYHGKSLEDWSQSLNGSGACDLMREMLIRRHIAPTYGSSVPLSPGTSDPFIIGETPRIFQTGHQHECCSSGYRGVLLLATPSWIASEKTKGAGTAIVVDLSTLESKRLSFAP